VASFISSARWPRTLGAMSTRPDKIAGFLFMVAGVLVSAIWYIYLFAAPDTTRTLMKSVVEQLQYTFSPEHSDRWWFMWLVALPILCFAIGSAYLLNVARSRRGAVPLLTLSVVLAASSFVLNDWALALFVALPILWGSRCVRGT